jgi:carboxypeptidase family protein
MRIFRIAAVCGCVLLAISDFSTAQQQIIINGSPADMPVQLPGMGPRQPKTGTARLRGRVLSVDNGGPVRRAQVRIMSQDIGSKTAMTDADGRYEFRDLPAGRFNLSATKAGYVTVQYGQTRPFESGKAIDLTDGQVMDKADFSMPRGSAISGRLVDEFGDPVADAMVSAMRSAWSGGRRRLQPTGRTAMTNDLGQFRIYGLSPGDYYVNATFRGMDMMGMEIAMAAAMGNGAGGGGPVGSNPNSGYSPTYFPGTANGAEAQKITLAVGQEAQNTDFALLPVKLAKITGTVISSEGKPVEGSMINAVPRNVEGMGMMMMAGNARSDKNGNFTIPNLAPGEYTLQSRSLQIMTTGGGDNMMFTARIGGDTGAESEAGTLPITVSGEDLSNVVIVTSKGATASGRVVFEDGSKPSSVTTIRVSATAVDSDAPAAAFGGGSGNVKADGTFELKGLSGIRIIRAVNVPSGWMLMSVRVNGNDITDSGMDFKSGESTNGIEVTLTSKLTEVNGTVKDSSQQVKDYTVVVFADEPQKWTLPNSRYITGSRPDQEGRFQIKNLPAGGYLAIAVDYLAQGEWNDPDILERLKVQATGFSIKEGETKTLNLTLK